MRGLGSVIDIGILGTTELIKRRQSERSAIGKNHTNTSNELSPSIVNVAKKGNSVKYSIPDTDGDSLITEQQNEGGLDAGSDDIEIPPVMSASKDGQLHICRELQLVVRLFRNTQDWKRS